MKIGMLLTGLGYLLALFGNILSAGFFFYGIYIIFAKNFSSGLVLIGASVLTLIAAKIISNGLMLLGAVLSKKAIEKEINLEK
ncbi:hypothetical protein [Alishewanella sp. HH-ZS]|uniref:hypothetical protein n=1 Tax=Alishewanella sp. HH-ZS TaxID=1856684 RepID=UPI0008235FE2|nr:hypothetical protein [Alishewanella sp. HH-ZS]OCW92932.1 hypothetical protein A9165_15895 [Alishewanella sp. HH-ZS]